MLTVTMTIMSIMTVTPMLHMMIMLTITDIIMARSNRMNLRGQ